MQVTLCVQQQTCAKHTPQLTRMQDSTSAGVPLSLQPRFLATTLNVFWAAYSGLAVQSAIGPDSMAARSNRPPLRGHGAAVGEQRG